MLENLDGELEDLTQRTVMKPLGQEFGAALVSWAAEQRENKPSTVTLERPGVVVDSEECQSKEAAMAPLEPHIKKCHLEAISVLFDAHDAFALMLQP